MNEMMVSTLFGILKNSAVIVSSNSDKDIKGIAR